MSTGFKALMGLFFLFPGICLLGATFPSVLPHDDDRILLYPIELFFVSIAMLLIAGWFLFSRGARRKSK